MCTSATRSDPRRTTPPRHHPQVHRPASAHADRPPRPRPPRRRILSRRTRRPARAGATWRPPKRSIPGFVACKQRPPYQATHQQALSMITDDSHGAQQFVADQRISAQQGSRRLRQRRARTNCRPSLVSLLPWPEHDHELRASGLCLDPTATQVALYRSVRIRALRRSRSPAARTALLRWAPPTVSSSPATHSAWSAVGVGTSTFAPAARGSCAR
jgi:hypothetical protein